MSEKIIKFPEQPKTTEKIISETIEAIRQRRLEEEKYILCGDDVIGVMEENETISDVARREIRNSLGLSMLGHLTKQALISKEDLQKNPNEQISILDRMEEAATERKELQEGIDKLKGF